MAQPTASAGINWNRALSQLDTLLEDVKSESSQEQKFLKWLKIYRICIRGENSPAVSKEKQALMKVLIQSFKREVLPSIEEFRELNNINLNPEYIRQYRVRFIKLLEDSESYLKDLPMKALDLLDDIDLSVYLYFTRKMDPRLKTKMMNVLFAKRIHLIKSFAKEGGSKSLVETQTQITKSLKEELQKIEAGSKGDSKLSAESIIEDDLPDIPVSGDQLGVNQVIFPEETTDTIPSPGKKQKELEIPLGADTLSEPEHPVSVNASQSEPQPSVPIPEHGPIDVYPYSLWKPTSNWNDFIKYRYCESCGAVINPNTRSCTKCQKNYT